MAGAHLEQVVYFIQSGVDGPIKIGAASDPGVRLRTLQTGSPERLRLLGTVPGGQEREAQYHGYLSAHRLHGEWFKPVPEVLAVTPGPEARAALAELLGLDQFALGKYRLDAAIAARLYRAPAHPFARNITARESAQCRVRTR